MLVKLVQFLKALSLMVSLSTLPVIPSSIVLACVYAITFGALKGLWSKVKSNRKKIAKKYKVSYDILLTLGVAAIIGYVCSVASFMSVSLVFGLLIGWLCHIIADCFNKKGVPLLWPLSPSKIHVACFKTGTWHEYVFIVLWLGGLGAWLTLL